MQELTERQAEVLGWVYGFIRLKGYAPTVREIGTGLDISASTVQEHLVELRRKGRIDWEANRSRTIRILEEG